MSDNWYAPPNSGPPVDAMRIRGTPSYGWLAVGAFTLVTGAAWLTALLDLAVVFGLPASPIGRIETILGAFDTLVRWGGIISFLIWVHRATANLIDFRHPTGEKPGAAVVSFFIPFANFVLPIRTMSRIAAASAAETDGRSPLAVVSWWLAYLAASFVAIFRRIQGPSLRTAAAFKDAIALELLRAAFLTVSIVSLFVVVRHVSRGQERLREKMSTR